MIVVLCTLKSVWVIQVIAFNKAKWIVHLISVHVIAWKLYFNQNKRKNLEDGKGQKRKGRRGGRVRTKRKEANRMVPGTGNDWIHCLGLCCQQLRKEESRALKYQGPSQNFSIFQMATINLDAKEKHILEMKEIEKMSSELCCFIGFK